MYKLEKPLYHGTSAASAIFIIGGYGFNPPLYLTEDKAAAIHYARAATAYLERYLEEEAQGNKPIKDGFALFTFYSVPDKECLIPDDYNPEAEPNQWKYTKRLKGLSHFRCEYFPLDVNKDERIRLQCFAIGMWRR